MEKKKKIRIFGFKLKDAVQLGTILGVLFWGWSDLQDKFDTVNHRMDKMESRFEARFDGIDRRLDGVDRRLDKIEGDVKQTSDLLNVYLTWRFLYMNDPARKDLRPRYDPNTRTLELIDKNNRVIK